MDLELSVCLHRRQLKSTSSFPSVLRALKLFFFVWMNGLYHCETVENMVVTQGLRGQSLTIALGIVAGATLLAKLFVMLIS